MKPRGAGLAIYAAGAYLFLHLPLLILSIFSFNASRFTVWEGFSLRWYSAALHDSQLTEAALNSLIIAVVATLEEAALDLGANEWQAFRYVTLPAILPGVVAAALLAFTVSFDDYVMTSLVAGVDSETLPMVIYAIARRGVNPVVNAISALIVIGFGSLVLISERLRTT